MEETTRSAFTCYVWAVWFCFSTLYIYCQNTVSTDPKGCFTRWSKHIDCCYCINASWNMRFFVGVCTREYNGFFSALAVLLNLYYRLQIETAFLLYPQNVARWRAAVLRIKGNIAVVCVGIEVFLLTGFCFPLSQWNSCNAMTCCNAITSKSISDLLLKQFAVEGTKSNDDTRERGCLHRLRRETGVQAVCSLSFILQLQFL